MSESLRSQRPDEADNAAVHTTQSAPSLVALVAAFEALDGAAVQVRGVSSWVERLASTRPLDAEEAVRLWAFVEKTRAAASGVREDADRLAELLLHQFVSEDGGWVLSKKQEQELHEVLAALARTDSERYSGGSLEPGGRMEESPS